MSTNTLSGAAYGVLLTTPAATAQIWITSNTIVPAVTGANNTFGMVFDGLAGGATIENNTVAYRTSGSMSAKISYALYAQSSSGMQIDHNRIDEPGMITGGTFYGAYLSNAANLTFKFNDVYSTAPASVNAALFRSGEATGGSGLIVLRDNIFFSSFTAPGVGFSSGTVLISDNASMTGLSADYNDYFSSDTALAFTIGTGGGPAGVQGLAAWQTATGGDGQSISVNPLWFNPASGGEDFHPMTQAVNGRYLSGGGTATDGATSLTIDSGDPAEGFGLEISNPRANQGSYGLTAQASQPFARPDSRAASLTNAGRRGRAGLRDDLIGRR